MATVVTYTGNQTRNFGGITFDPGDSIVFDEVFAAQFGRTDPDEFAEFFVGVYSNQGRTPYLESKPVKPGNRKDPTKRTAPASQAAAVTKDAGAANPDAPTGDPTGDPTAVTATGPASGTPSGATDATTTTSDTTASAQEATS